MSRRLGGFILGVLAGLAVLELCFAGLTSVQLPPSPAVAADTIDGAIATLRQFDEGIRTSRFSAAGSRLTGRPRVPGAPAIALLGDSYVFAREVSDAATMGAWVERLAGDDGRVLNVRQYGWRGAGPGQYLAVADELMARRDVERVMVVLSEDDLDDRAAGPPAPFIRVDTGGRVSVVGVLEPHAAPVRRTLPPSRVRMLIIRRWDLLALRAQAARARWMRRLGFAQPVIPRAASERHVQIPGSAPYVAFAPQGRRDDTQIPAAVVRELTRAYQTKLAIVYIADVGVAGGDTATTAETRLLDECRRLAIPCGSTRGTMLAARRRNVIVRGFSTTVLGEGHLNDSGHELMGRYMWSMIRDPRAAPVRPR